MNPAITLFALVFGAIWITTNLYALYPLVQTVLDHVVLRDSIWRESVDTTALFEADSLPSVDILVPAYEEAAVIEQAISSIAASEYPGPVSTTVLLEPGDDQTYETVRRLRATYDVEILVVPEGYPGRQNKPRALNYAFEHTDGDIVGVIDAEDIVEESMVAEAVAAIRQGADFAHGRLDMANEDDGWLNLMFRAEYGFWYTIITPAFVHVDYPLPIAGTCCFFERSVLADAANIRADRRDDAWDESDWAWIDDQGLAGVRPWDAQNVTEDFEIGLTLWEHGYEFRYLDAAATEESPLELDEWIKQRTRWKKGKLYTFFERIRNPPASLATRGHIYWQSLLPHLGPINIAGIVTLTLIGSLARYEPGILVDIVLAFGLVFSIMYAVFSGVGYLLTTERRWGVRLRRSVVTAVTLPVYWLLQWGADIRALQQTYTGHLEWETTTHLGQHITERETTDPSSISRDDTGHTLSRNRRWLALTGLVALGFALRVFDIAGAPLWVAELAAVAGRADSLAATLQATVRDPNPPLYYLLLYGWIEVLGDRPEVVRSLSVVFGLATIPSVYLLTTELFDDRTGLLAALLVSVSPFFVHYSRVARMYALVILLTALSWYWLLRLRDRRRVETAGYLLSTALLVYTHLFGLLVVLAQLTYVTLSEINGGISRQRWRRIQATLFALSLPWLVTLGGLVVEAALGPGAFTPDPSPLVLTDTGLSFVGFPEFYPFLNDSLPLYILASTVLFVYLGNLVVSLFAFDNGLPTIVDADQVSQMGALLTVVVVVPFLISTVFPMFVPEFAVGAGVSFVVLAARGIRTVPLARVRAAMLAAIVASSLLFTGVYFATESVEPTDFVGQTVRASADADDVVVHESRSLEPFADYYYPDPAFERTTVPNASRVDRSDLDTLARHSRQAETVYLVQYSYTGGPAVEYLDACRATTERLNTGVFSVYTFRTHQGCPSPSRVLSTGSRG